MPGPYAHITLLHELMQPDRLESIFPPGSAAPAALKTYFPYCSLGAVSPDYPNLARGDASAAQWADAMHYTRACEMITSGIRRIRRSTGSARERQLAWLLGYCAHVATDVTIHPVVQAKVGVYAQNQRHHRVCEMNQDSHIYRRMDLGEIGDSNQFAVTVAHCSDLDDTTRLDGAIAALWEGMLADVHPRLFAVNPPDCAAWHRAFVGMVVECAAAATRLFPLAGVISARMDLAYPAYAAVDRQYLADLEVPSETPRHLSYDQIFDAAARNVAGIWHVVERALCGGEPSELPRFGDWNLDNGLDEHGRLVFW